MLFDQINAAKNNIKSSRKFLINNIYQTSLINYTTSKIIKNKYKKKNEHTTDFHFFKLILKDLMVQT